MLTFQLRPFLECRPQAKLTVAGTLSRRDNVLHLLFRISGDLTGLILPGPESRQRRCDNLWQTTCCECFIQAEGKICYHELNFSSGGCWNLYHFSDYRTAMREEQAVRELSPRADLADADYLCGCALPLAGLYQPEEVLNVGLSCVLEHGDGGKSYWALSHPGQRPDFHLPEGFGLRV